MEKNTIGPLKLIGIKLEGKTSNENGQSNRDCGKLWQQFEQEKVSELIPHKSSDAIYAVYYDYEGDETGAFSYFIGCKVEETSPIPKGLNVLFIPQQEYYKTVASGQMPACIANAWRTIWRSDIQRKFSFDFEIYGEKSQEWNNAEVPIYISYFE
ncbi:hypothetical protein GCM10028791_27440 [Echinicola sediminis]